MLRLADFIIDSQVNVESASLIVRVKFPVGWSSLVVITGGKLVIVGDAFAGGGVPTLAAVSILSTGPLLQAERSANKSTKQMVRIWENGVIKYLNSYSLDLYRKQRPPTLVRYFLFNSFNDLKLIFPLMNGDNDR